MELNNANEVTPLVTIGIPFYNEDKYLGETIRSAVNQSYPNIKIIASDNCSTDQSYSVAKQFADSDRRIELIRHEKNIGAIENFLFTLSRCTTPYFLWLGAHDILLPTFIEEAIMVMTANPSVVLLYPKAVFFENDGTIKENADSDIDTTGMNRLNGLLKVANNLVACTALHGVFITEKLKKIPLIKNASDMLLLFLTAGYGEISSSKTVQFHRRIVRKETFTQQKKRFKNIGMIDDTKLDLHTLRSILHYKYLFDLPELGFKEKMIVAAKIKEIFSRRFSYFSWKTVFKYYILNDFQLKVVVYLLFVRWYLLTKKYEDISNTGNS